MRKVSVQSLNERRYAETFSVFLEHSREYPLMIDHLTDVMRRLPSGLKMVDIGAGNRRTEDTTSVTPPSFASTLASAIG